MNTIPRFSNPDPILIFDPISDPISAYSVSLHGCWTDSWTWHLQNWIQSLQVCSVVVQSLGHVWLLDCSTPGFPVLQYLLEFAQIHVHWIGDAIQPSSPLPPPYPFAFNLSQHQGLFQWVSSLHQVAKVLELQLQHQSFQWIFKIDFL